MKVVTHPEVLIDRTTRAFVDAVADTLLDAQQMAPRLTGEYADSLEVLSIGEGTPLRGRAASSVPRASGIRPEEGSAGAIKLSTPLRVDHLVAVIGSHLPQSGAIERGAFVKEGRGPHMRKVGTLGEAGGHFIEHMTRHLQAAH